MIKHIALAAALMSLATVAVGCAPGQAVGEVDGEMTADELNDDLKDVPYCEDGDNKLGLGVALKIPLVRMEDGPIKFTFTRTGETRNGNDAKVRQTHSDGSWVEYHTTDDLQDHVEKSPPLLVTKSSKDDSGVSTKLQHGDLLAITANFDIKHWFDTKHCKTSLRITDDLVLPK